MRTIYVDNDCKCHVASGADMIAVETDFFDGKCDDFIAGYRLIPDGETWTREDGKVFHGFSVFPWQDSRMLDAMQAGYEAAMTEMQDMQDALELLGVTDNGQVL